MSFKGMIEDVAVVDVMQLIRLGGHSGTLSVNSGREEGFVGFERGRIVSAWNQRSRRLGELLVAAGAIDEGQLVSALEAQNAEQFKPVRISGMPDAPANSFPRLRLNGFEWRIYHRVVTH